MGKAEQDFVNKDSFAILGNTRRMRYAVKGLKKMGKTVYFVDPKFSEDSSRGRFNALSQIPADVDAAIIDSPMNTKKILAFVKEAATKGISDVWLNFQSAPNKAVTLAKDNGMNVLSGQCVVVWLPTMGVPHSLHRGLWKIIGKY